VFCSLFCMIILSVSVISVYHALVHLCVASVIYLALRNVAIYAVISAT
jgi:hypothetical protein